MGPVLVTPWVAGAVHMYRGTLEPVQMQPDSQETKLGAREDGRASQQLTAAFMATKKLVPNDSK